MDAFIYKAALLCEDCVTPLKRGLEDTGTEDNGDSDRFPQGPYANGGGEADCPQHCDSCGLFLENPLTTDGKEYVRNLFAAASQPGSIIRLTDTAENGWGPFYGISREEEE